MFVTAADCWPHSLRALLSPSQIYYKYWNCFGQSWTFQHLQASYISFLGQSPKISWLSLGTFFHFVTTFWFFSLKSKKKKNEKFASKAAQFWMSIKLGTDLGQTLCSSELVTGAQDLWTLKSVCAGGAWLLFSWPGHRSPSSLESRQISQ